MWHSSWCTCLFKPGINLIRYVRFGIGDIFLLWHWEQIRLYLRKSYFVSVNLLLMTFVKFTEVIISSAPFVTLALIAMFRTLWVYGHMGVFFRYEFQTFNNTMNSIKKITKIVTWIFFNSIIQRLHTHEILMS